MCEAAMAVYPADDRDRCSACSWNESSFESAPLPAAVSIMTRDLRDEVQNTSLCRHHAETLCELIAPFLIEEESQS